MEEDSGACSMIDDLATFCEPEVNWPSENCVALREGAQAARDSMTMSDGASKARLRQLCARGRALACERMDARSTHSPMVMTIRSAPCATRAKMPHSAAWIEFGDQAQRVHLDHHFRVHEKGGTTNSIGERLSVRQSIPPSLESAPRQGAATEFTASALPGDAFTNLNAAATAGCEAKTSPRTVPQKRKADPEEESAKHLAAGYRRARHPAHGMPR